MSKKTNKTPETPEAYVNRNEEPNYNNHTENTENNGGNGGHELAGENHNSADGADSCTTSVGFMDNSGSGVITASAGTNETGFINMADSDTVAFADVVVSSDLPSPADPILLERWKNIRETGVDLTNAEREMITHFVLAEFTEKNSHMVLVDGKQLADLAQEKLQLESDVREVIRLLKSLFGGVDLENINIMTFAGAAMKVLSNKEIMAPLEVIFERNKSLAV